MGLAYITDYIEKPDLEIAELNGRLSDKPSSEVEVLLVWHKLIDANFLDQFPNLKGIVRYGVGFDQIDLEEVTSRGLVFCNTPDYGTDEVSDTALAMLMNIVRGVYSYDFQSRSHFEDWQENTIKSIRRSSELRIGVIGAGRIGTALMRKAKHVGFQVAFYDPYLNSGYEKAVGVERFYDLHLLLANSDIISIHTPLNSQTRSMVNKSFVAMMKKGASLINTARGEIIDDLDTLFDSMLEGHLFAVGLDVLPDEPPISCRMIEAWRLRDPISHRIIINPHTSYYSQESYSEMRSKAATNAARILDGLEPLNIIKDGR